MHDDKREMRALLKAATATPKRDNSVYHKAIGEAREAFEAAVSALGEPVKVKTKAKLKRNGDYVVKWTFKRTK